MFSKSSSLLVLEVFSSSESLMLTCKDSTLYEFFGEVLSRERAVENNVGNIRRTTPFALNDVTGVCRVT